ncbi:hypothetical protein VroAM7_01810 [Vibrio rotiferianus]|uniref:Uncharacterized protein n=1 Tax=Vibrio rotiferianus TaxID=190895 RepID=A0A510I2Z1_9VIBR|nr:hypothetical protein VroAM7_01810 [Vibrio rotiferianus]
MMANTSEFTTAKDVPVNPVKKTDNNSPNLAFHVVYERTTASKSPDDKRWQKSSEMRGKVRLRKNIKATSIAVTKKYRCLTKSNIIAQIVF